MNSLRIFLQRFLKNEGHYVFLSLLIAKISAFISSVYIIRLLPASDYGKLSIAASLFAVFSSFSGMGSYQGLLRFGSVLNTADRKKALSTYFFKKGFLLQVILTVLFLACALLYNIRGNSLFLIFIFFAVRLIGFYFYLHLQSELRINNKNRSFARLNNAVNIGGLILSLGGAWLFHLYGYLFGLAAAPFISLFWLKLSNREAVFFQKKVLWNYSAHSATMSFLSDALFSVDILLLGFLLSDTDVAEYRVAILLPSNISFLSLTFMQADFSLIAKNAKNKAFLRDYILNYYKIFVPAALMIVFVGWFFREEILTLFFKNQYSGVADFFVIFLAIFTLNMLMRNLFGNLLSAVGRVYINTKVSVFALLFLIPLAFALVPLYGVFGMVTALSATLFMTGCVYMFYFYRYFKSLK